MFVQIATAATLYVFKKSSFTSYNAAWLEPKLAVAVVKRGEVGEERGKHLSFSTHVRARVLNISSFSLKYWHLLRQIYENNVVQPGLKI